MSRSKKKHPFKAVTSSESEKEDKHLANRKFRRITKIEVHTGNEIYSNLRELSNSWSFAKDGKYYDPDRTDLRK